MDNLYAVHGANVPWAVYVYDVGCSEDQFVCSYRTESAARDRAAKLNALAIKMFGNPLTSPVPLFYADVPSGGVYLCSRNGGVSGNRVPLVMRVLEGDMPTTERRYLINRLGKRALAALARRELEIEVLEVVALE